MCALMGNGAVALVAGTAVIGGNVARDTGFVSGPRTPHGIAPGLVVTLPLTLIVAGYMSRHGSHWIGTPLPGVATFPLMGWSLTAGGYRPAQVVYVDGIQALPLLGLWLDRRASKNRRTLRGAAVLWSLVCLALFAQALAGQPLTRV